MGIKVILSTNEEGGSRTREEITYLSLFTCLCVKFKPLEGLCNTV